MTECAEKLLSQFVAEYKSSGRVSFSVTDYIGFPNHDFALAELIKRGMLVDLKDIIGSVALSEGLIEDLRR